MRQRHPHRPRAFTLIELLVVVAIIATLIAILLPSLGQARAQSRLVVCGTNLKSMGVGIHAYANEYDGRIPRGPDQLHPFDFAGSAIATNQLWSGDRPSTAHPHTYVGIGPLYLTTAPDPRLYWCPADDSRSQSTELPQIGTDDDSFGSYYYRQLDYLPEKNQRGNLDSLGVQNVRDVEAEISVPVTALALDANALGRLAQFYRTNHRGKTANVLFHDGSVRRFSGRDNCLALPPEAFDNFALLPTYIDQLLSNADYAYKNHPWDAPRLDALP